MDYPGPPAFYKSYGPDPAALHPCAASLKPPAPPAESYQCFGDAFTVHAPKETLADLGVEELFSFELQAGAHPTNYAAEIKRLLGELSACYGGLLETAASVGSTPAKVTAGVDRFRVLAANLEFVVNSYRPHEARQQLIELQRTQIARRKAATAEVRAALAVAQAEYEAAGRAATAAVEGAAGDGMEVEAAALPAAAKHASLADVLASVRAELEAAPAFR